MAKNWHWIELIGFDNQKKDFGVNEFLSNLSEQPEGVSILFSHIDFVNDFQKDKGDYPLLPCDCSYSGHFASGDRKRQNWTSFELKGLIEKLHEKGVKVIFSIFNFFEYFNDDGNKIATNFCKEHKELYCLNQNAEVYENSIHILKKFSDGSYYEDYFIAKLKEVIDYYGFDGVQIADGISCSRPSIQNGDFSDDTVSQFTDWLKGNKKAFDEAKLKPTFDKKKEYKIRRKYILENLQFEFLCFTNDRWKGFYDKLYSVINPKDYIMFINSFWTREPFEAFYRYGIDYKVSYREGVYALMVEEVSTTNPTLSKEGRGGFNVSAKQTRYVHYDFYLMQMLLKAYLPSFKQISLLPINDNQEQWNAIHESHNELKRAVYRRNNCKVFVGGEWKACAEAPFFCLSDGVSSNDWAMLKNLDDLKALSNLEKPLGYTLYYPKKHIKEDVKRYIENREYNFNKLSSELIKKGLEISSVITEDDLPGYKNPLLVLFPEFYEEDERKKLEQVKGLVVCVSYSEIIGHALSEGEIKISANQDLKCEFNQKLKKAECKVNGEDKHGAIWTADLRYKEWDKTFLHKLAKFLNDLTDAPKIVKKSYCECKINSFMKKDKKIVTLVSNDEFFTIVPEVKVCEKIKKVKSLTKYDGYKISSTENTFSLVIPARTMEIVEVEVE